MVKRLSKVAVGLCFLTIFHTGCYAQAVKEAGIVKSVEPAMDFSDTHDFGDVEVGIVAKHTFAIKNTTKNTLKIKGVNSSCGCTVSKIKEDSLKPEETALLEVAFNSKGYFGPVQQFAYVNTDDKENPILKFVIKANVIQPPKTKK